MSTPAITATPPEAEVTSSPRKRGQPLLAWLVIFSIVSFILWRHAAKPARDAASWMVPLQMQARYLVGVHSLKFPGASGKALYEQARSLVNPEGFSQRLRLAVLAGELVGPEEALRVLGELDEGLKRGEVTAPDDPRAAEVLSLLRKLYLGYEKGPSSPDVSDKGREKLRSALGWFGDLALAPEGGDPAAREKALAPARRTFVGFVILALGGLLALIAGGTLLVVLGSLALLGRLRGRLTPATGHGGLYAEMFAVYMLVYLGLGYLARLLPEEWMALWVQGVAMLVSLVALGWPILRGLTWRQVRSDLGLAVGDEAVTEVACGVGTYLAAVPLLFAGILVMLGLVFVQRRLGLGDPLSGGGPTHPIVGVALTANWWVWVQVFLVACVAAPLVEEIMFRGALYRHLREASGRGGRALRILFSAFASSFLFAMIHPQGWLGVPPLMGLAFVFALAREWRGTLLPPMIAHGVNNGVSTLLLLLMAS
jgi:membrane protease YdiL (CAAX protease family)